MEKLHHLFLVLCIHSETRPVFHEEAELVWGIWRPKNENSKISSKVYSYFAPTTEAQDSQLEKLSYYMQKHDPWYFTCFISSRYTRAEQPGILGQVSTNLVKLLGKSGPLNYSCISFSLKR